MRKIFAVVCMTIVFYSASRAQSSYKNNYSFQKNNYAVASIQVPFDADDVSDAIKDYMLSNGYKDAHYKDFTVFRSVPLENGGGMVTDAYFTVNRKSRSEKDMTIVSLLPVKKGETLSPAAAEDSSYLRASMVYLDSLKNRVYRFSLTRLIDAQQKTLDKTNAKLLSLKNDSGDIAKKIRNNETNLAENKTSQEKQQQVISNTPTGDTEGLTKAHKKMDKLMDSQADYEKKIRNYKADLDDNTKERQAQQGILEKVTQALNALKQKHQNLGVATP